MNKKTPPNNSLIISLIFFLLFRKALSDDNDDDPFFKSCSVPKTCGDGLLNISFPFYIHQQQEPYCGYPGFQIYCNNKGNPFLKFQETDYIIHQIFYNNQSLRVSNAAFSGNIFSSSSNSINGCFDIDIPGNLIQNLTLPEGKFELVSDEKKLFLFFDCNLTDSSDIFGDCGRKTVNSSSMGRLALFEDGNNTVFDHASEICGNRVAAPVDEEIGDGGSRSLSEILNNGFLLKLIASNCSECEESGGRCGFNETTFHFKCFCKDRPHSRSCISGNSNTTFAFKAAIAASGATIGFVMLLVFCFRRKLFALCTMQTEDDHNVEDLLRNFGIFPERYSYSDVKRSTNDFKEKLGEGGYGSVYKGKLHDGRFVAIKMLNNTKGNGEEFINEIASISRTSHVNIVSLVGFCCEKTKPALLYEYMPNGSLEKFIFNATPNNRKLGWETLYEISLGIARGLEYLHRGCSTRILHFDIKPHNILLDQHLVPKIADFGLAKICPQKESIISMLGARGTAGYIAPEVFCRNFGAVSYKSDVYSYGMMVLEMVGGRKNIDVNVDNLSAIYFPHWIYKKIEVEEELGLEGVLNEEDEDKARKMIIVSFWCIQSDPSVRPTMSKVVEMLEGNVASIKIPPKPYLSSPPRSPINSSTTILT